ncbi:hypothetical protein TrLO_g7276 [Triparma laevis f. longispina]|uniref:Kinesin light chain n=1 Tax=Triparma laevis f. longispina TaxID=1714387 RepID=A0A9W7DXP8_9STRA|nr:hypothetical protein TrLO_g7276 [Triparma laevis f. longispina]
MRRQLKFRRRSPATLNNLGSVYDDLKNYEKAFEYYEKDLKGSEKTLGKNHPDTLATVMNIAIIYVSGLNDYGKAEELFERALMGYEAQLGKDNKYTKLCAKNFKLCLEYSGNSESFAELISSYPGLAFEEAD